MPNYTDAELEAAVSQFVRSEIKTERTDLGPLSADYTFDEVQELAASTLVFDPSAIFYLLSLSANRVNQDVEQALGYLVDIIAAIDEVGRDTTVVEQTSLLEDAASALVEVERNIEEYSAVTEQPFERYIRALDTFTSKSLTPNIRRDTGLGFPSTYEIVRPPQEAQSSIKTNIAALRELHTLILSEVEQLGVALSEFLSANLPLLSIQSSVQKARKDLRALKREFDATTKEGAIEKTRDAFLRIHAGKSVVTNLTTISDPRESRMASTTSSTDRAAAAYPADSSTPAEVSTSQSAPYLITPTTNEIKLEIDGGIEQVATLTTPDPASVSGTADETYDVHAASTAEIVSSAVGPYTVPASPDNLFSVYVDGIGYQVSLTSGSRTAALIAGEINAATRIDGQPGTFGAVATASDDGTGKLELVHDTAGAHSLALGSAPILNPALSLTDEEEAQGEDANNEIRFYVDDLFHVAVTLTTGSARTAAQVAADISAVSILLSATAETVITDTGTITVVKVSSTAYGEGSYVRVESSTATQEAGAALLGFSEGQDARSSFVDLADLDSAISALSGVETSREEEILQQGVGGTAVLDGALYKLRLPTGTITASPVAGDSIYIAGGVNVGWYRISSFSLGGVYDEFVVDRAWPVHTGDEALNQSWEIHRQRLTISSSSSSLTSKVTVNSASANTEVGLTPGTTIGSVSAVRIKTSTAELNFEREDVSIGDKLVLEGPTYTSEHTVYAVTDDGYQIEVTPEVQNDLVAHQYRVDGEGALAYAEFAEDLGDWDTQVLEPSRYDEDILELERALNPLLVNKNPSAALVGTANTAAADLQTVYTSLSTILADFTTLPVVRVDALLDMLQERGLERAHELLTLGEIEEFFALTKDGASYGGNFLEKIRAIAQNDIPQGRSLAEDNVDDRLISSFEDTDADFDFSDQDDERGSLEIDDIPDLEEEEDILDRSL